MADNDKIFGALRHRKREREMKRYRLRGEADSPEGKEVREMDKWTAGDWCLVAVILMTTETQRYWDVPPAVFVQGCLQSTTVHKPFHFGRHSYSVTESYKHR